MCDWCKKASLGKVMVSGDSLPMICEHCGSSIDKKLTYENIVAWAKEIVEYDNQTKLIKEIKKWTLKK